MNSEALGILAAAAMERIEEQYGEDASLRTAALVLEIDLPGRTEILVTCTDNRAWVELAFLKEGVETLEDELDRLREELDSADD